MLDNVELLKFLASFAIITIFIYSIYYYINRYGIRVANKKEKNINVLETHYFSKNKALLLIEVKDKILLLSMDDKGFSKLKEWEKSEK